MSDTPKRDEYENRGMDPKYDALGDNLVPRHLADAALAEADERIRELEAENAALRVSLHAAAGTGAPIGCPRCGGAGAVWVESAPGSSMAGYRTSCPGCGGKGWVK